ncbi:MAG TPA: flagellar basal body L-ring protein FlgH [Allosphingosinicella sp.]|jgi:flagellar L-ring protein precursor FlgH
MRATLIFPLAFTLTAAFDPPAPGYQPGFSIPAPPAMANGSIFQATNGYAPLTSGQRAAQVGDVLTVVLTERTVAQASAGTTTQRDGSIGLLPPITGLLSKLFGASDATAGGNSQFGGTGQTTQSNQLSGEISVTVQEVFPNGTMLVQGEKHVRLNRGNEFIQVAGLVRPADILPDNRIASSRLADARITYSGRGEIARAARQGWLQRFFNIVSPF